ncbi:MAG: hypothetical protein VX265_13735 [Myxococcota bacterium]|nr:hypothetical protein [Myxococcota bacterium]MEC8423955.1 hypothetical protein [Myxococcota bacterium]
MALAAGTLSIGCKAGDPTSLSASPTAVAWGEIDFQQDMPVEGYDEQAIMLTNESSEEVVVEVLDLDLEHLCSPGIPETPLEIGTLGPGQTLGFFVSVCDYSRERGERDTELRGAMAFGSSAGGRAEVTWSFTPVEVIRR